MKNLTSIALNRILTDLYGVEVAKAEIERLGAKLIIDSLHSRRGSGDLHIDAGWSFDDVQRVRRECNRRGYHVFPIHYVA